MENKKKNIGRNDGIKVSPGEIEEAIVDVLKKIYDPEIPVNIYDLGLIYDINVFEDGKVHILMTLTAPGCPVADSIVREVKERVELVYGVKEAEVELTFDPPWTQDFISEEGKLMLGMM